MLYKKYGIKKLRDLQGLSVVKNVITSFINNIHRSPSFLLFTGRSGCGKSSVAEVISKSIQCLKPLKNGTCCSKCDRCIQPDSIYVKLTCPTFDEVVAIINYKSNAMYSVNTIVVEIQDVDLLSPSEQSKIAHYLEEIKSISTNEIITICTCIDYFKVHQSIKSRAVHIPFPDLSDEEKFRVLESVCNSEGIDLEEDVLRYILRSKALSARDLIQMIELHLLDDTGASIASELMTLDTLVAQLTFASLERDTLKINKLIEEISKYSGDLIIKSFESLASEVNKVYYS
jgi:DNA polymerase-3 subunit gamma/tau